MTYVSSLGMQILMTNSLQKEQKDLSKLNEQLSSGKKNADLTDYAPLEARQLMNFQNSVNAKDAYTSGLKSVKTRLEMYDTTLSDIESITADAKSLASQNQSYDATKIPQIKAQVENYLKQVSNDLNQKVGNRYVYAGIRYTTQPVSDDLTVLSGAPAATIHNDNLTLPDYDNAYVLSGTVTDANAYTADSVLADDNYSITYGVSSDDPSFQRLINGLRYMYRATQTTDPATYQSDMNQAATMLATALQGIQGIHTAVAGNQNTINSQVTNLSDSINTLKDQVDDIQKVDLTEVSIKITLLQTQLEASYSATAKLGQLSIVKYL
ncbi:MAG: flagellin [Bdellovibrionales bacterium]